jgi:hypothetical protein
MVYKVIEKFKDLKDNDHIYEVNDIYPRKDIKLEDIPQKRIKELTTTKNKIGKILIEKIKEEPDEKIEE